MSRGVILASALLAACSFEPDYGETRYVCRLERCPEGYVCIDRVCVTGAADAAAAPDAAVDAGPEPSPDAADPSCDRLFGAANGYQLCSETATTCTFNVDVNETSCDHQCGLFGSTCESASDSDQGFPCVVAGATACATTHNSVICTCVR